MPITIHEANQLIDELRKKPVPASSEPEDLLLPVDSDIDVVQDSNRYRVNLVADEQVVSWLTIIDLSQRVGGALLRLGAIAGVGTHDAYRFRGLSRRVMVNALRWMRQHGFDVTQLYGINSFYPKFGFVPAFPNIMASIAVRDAEEASTTGYRLADFDPEAHLAEMLAIYQQNNARRTGTILRDPACWQPNRRGLNWWTQCRWQVVLNRHGRLAGYLVYDSAFPAVTLLEVGFTRPAVFSVLLRSAAGMALVRRVEKVQMALPEDHPFLEYCKPFGMTVESRFRRDGGAMVRLINPLSTLQKLAPELGPRLRGKGSLKLATNCGVVSLSWSVRNLAVAEGMGEGLQASLPQWALVQMVYGYRLPSALALEGMLKAPARAVTALECLFPLQSHYFYTIDEF